MSLDPNALLPLLNEDEKAALAIADWQAQDPILRDLWIKRTPEEIAVLLGRTVGAIRTRAARLGLPRRAPPGRKPGSRMMREEDLSALHGVPYPSGESEGQVFKPKRIRPAEEKPAIDPPVRRICLMCLSEFPSLGRHNRICPSCKESAEYGAATSLAEIHFPI